MKRIAIIERERCVNLKSCDFICGKYCPLNRAGKECIVIGADGKSNIDEVLCNGCKICVKRCPAKCISIINLPSAVGECLHRYGKNMFELFGQLLPKKGIVEGLIGCNGIGKTSALKILSGKIKPNFGKLDGITDQEILEHYQKGSVRDYFTDLYKGKIKVSYKPQRIELIPKYYSGTVKETISHISSKHSASKAKQLLQKYEISENQEIKSLSGGELQKFSIIAACCKDADFYFFDEPFSYLDVTTRIEMAGLIRETIKKNKAAGIVVEHDLALLDFVCDNIMVVYGEPACYGIFSSVKNVRRGINEYLDGYLAAENIRFRDYQIKLFAKPQAFTGKKIIFEFSNIEKEFNQGKNQKGFKLLAKSGEIRQGEVLGIVGTNALGKTTFMDIISGKLKIDKGNFTPIKAVYKQQYLEAPDGYVKDFFEPGKIEVTDSGWFRKNIFEKIGIWKIAERQIKELSGGELQKFHIALALSKDAQLYIFDEPSAFIDIEDRLIIASLIKDFVSRNEKAAIVVDHDIQFIDYIADRLIVFEGKPGIFGSVIGPLQKESGMNMLLKMLNLTYRIDKETGRAKINKPGSQLDIAQRAEERHYAS